MRMKRFNVLTIFSLIFMLSFSCLTAFAADKVNDNIKIEVENNSKGSITVNIPKVKGAKIFVTKIAELKDGELVLLDEFNKDDIDLKDIKTADELQKVIHKIKLNDDQKKNFQETDENGTAVFKELELGAYYICSDNPKDKEQVESAIVSIPKYDEKEGKMVFDITVNPKHEPPKPAPPKPAPQTSLNDNMLLYTLIALACALSGGVMYKLSKSKKNEKI